MEIQELREKASELKREKQSFLNDTFFRVKLAGEAVEATRKKYKFRTLQDSFPQGPLLSRILPKD